MQKYLNALFTFAACNAIMWVGGIELGERSGIHAYFLTISIILSLVAYYGTRGPNA